MFPPAPGSESGLPASLPSLSPWLAPLPCVVLRRDRLPDLRRLGHDLAKRLHAFVVVPSGVDDRIRSLRVVVAPVRNARGECIERLVQLAVGGLQLVGERLPT